MMSFLLFCPKTEATILALHYNANGKWELQAACNKNKKLNDWLFEEVENILMTGIFAVIKLSFNSFANISYPQQTYGVNSHHGSSGAGGGRNMISKQSLCYEFVELKEAMSSKARAPLTPTQLSPFGGNIPRKIKSFLMPPRKKHVDICTTFSQLIFPIQSFYVLSSFLLIFY